MKRSRLAGWKKIADHLGRDPRTVQNWERERALPVHRIPGGRGATVFAYADELAGWLDGGTRRVDCARQGPVPGLLVLPFDYRGHDASQAFVGDGLAQELISRLAAASLSSARVLSWTTARQCRGAGHVATSLARELAVRYLVEGSVLSTLERWVIDVRVVDAIEDRVVLVQRFACGGADIWRLQSTIAAAVCEHLALHLSGDLCEPAWTRETDPRAFLAFLKGARRFGRGTDASSREALAAFDEALSLDPGLAPARAYRGLALVAADSHRAWLRKDVQAEVRELSARCDEEAPTLVSSAVLHALIGRNECAWERVDRRLSAVVASHPSAVAVRLQLATNLTVRRRFDEARTTLAPVDGLERSLDADKAIAASRLWSRDFAGAIERFDSILAAEPNHVYAAMMPFMAAVYLHDPARAEAYERAMPADLHAKYAPFIAGCRAALDDDRSAASACRAAVVEQAAEARLPWYHAAMIDGLTGNADGAADNLQRSFAHHEATCSLGAVDPSFDRVRAHPRFREAVRAMDLPDEPPAARPLTPSAGATPSAA
jgi:TolB-like protein